MRVGNVPVASQVGGHDHPQTPLKRVKRMKGKDRAGREDLSVEPGFEHICSGGGQLMRLKLFHNLIGRPPQTLH